VTDAETKIAELETLCRQLTVECIDLGKDVERSEAGRRVLLRTLKEGRDALRVGYAKAALRIVEAALNGE
jgi:hypothetical protein